MTEVICQCGAQLHAFTPVCPDCGRANPLLPPVIPKAATPPLIPVPAARSRTVSSTGKTVLWAAGAALLIGFCVILYETSEQQQRPSQTNIADRQDDDLSLRLIDWSQDAVKRQLKTPGVAMFPGPVFGRDQYKIYRQPDGTFRVTSWVDSQNNFGAMLRSQWEVDLKKDQKGWEVVSVNLE